MQLFTASRGPSSAVQLAQPSCALCVDDGNCGASLRFRFFVSCAQRGYAELQSRLLVLHLALLVNCRIAWVGAVRGFCPGKYGQHRPALQHLGPTTAEAAGKPGFASGFSDFTPKPVQQRGRRLEECPAYVASACLRRDFCRCVVWSVCSRGAV